MDGTIAEITINGQDRYVTQMIGVASWEDKLLRRIRQLFGHGDGHFLIQKQGDIIFICRIGKPEVVKEQSNGY